MNSNHPCFNKAAHSRFGRIHLPVAPRCNIHCGFCDRRFSCVNESRPGVTAAILSPEEALASTIAALEKMPNISVAGIAGPGDPLANPVETLKTLALIHTRFPDLSLCLSTNGFALAEHVRKLVDLGLRHLTVTVNAVDPAIGARIYHSVNSPKGVISGIEGAALLLERQLEGIALAKNLGMTVKVNMVIIKGINEDHATDVAQKLSALGVDLMNCIPMLPVATAPLGGIGEPEMELMAEIRAKAEKWIPQMRHCGRCRADSVGLIGESRFIGMFAHK